jgi:hypothetical protein
MKENMLRPCYLEIKKVSGLSGFDMLIIRVNEVKKALGLQNDTNEKE